MTDEPTNLVLEHLRAIRAKLDRMDDKLSSHSSEFVGLRSALSGLASLQNSDRSEIAALVVRMDDLEGRASFRDAEVSELRRKVEEIIETLKSHQDGFDSFDRLSEEAAGFDHALEEFNGTPKSDQKSS